MATYAFPLLRLGVGEVAIPYAAIFLPVSLFLFIIRFLHSGKIASHNVLLFSLCLMYFSIPVSTIFSVEIETERILKLSIFLFLPILFVGTITNYNSLKTAVYTVIIVGIILSIYGFYVYITGDVGGETEQEWWTTNARYWGIHYSESTRNSDIYYASAPLMITLSLLYFKELQSNLFRISMLIISLLFGVAIIMSFSRGALISMTISVVALIYILRKYGRTHVRNRSMVWIIAFLLLFFIAGNKFLINYDMDDYFIGKIISIVSPSMAGSYLSETVSNEDRIELLKATFNINMAHPLGVGPGNLVYYYDYYGIFAFHPENNYIHILAENGIAGFVGYFIFTLYPLVILYKRLAETECDWLTSALFLTSVYLTSSYMFNVETYSLFNWIIHSIIWCGVTLRYDQQNA